MKSRFNRISVLLLVFVLSCIYSLTPISAVYAFDSESTLSFITESAELFVGDLLEEDDTYSSFRNANLLYMYPLYDSTASNIIAHYYELVTDHMVGYLIVDSETGTVLEFSATDCSPYANIQASNSLQNSTECKRVYCFWDYGVVNGNNVVFQNSVLDHFTNYLH